MRVQELVIDGFKSYATRTVISDWDESFNCITGLNGSGKSNILDAICFVLGITTMSMVRASNQQDLIYKRGQAGVTKASVTLVFDNKDRSKSPVGFEDQPIISVTRQIVLGGTSKYLLNGHRAQQSDIKKLFQSVQLNIDNPNFLILQGRITKVLNMRPTEILALIEEAAGTRMFETRRENALKTLAKKDRDIQYNASLLKEEIEPKLTKLRNEKRDYLEFQRAQSMVEVAEKLVYAHDYLELTERVTNETASLEAAETQKQDSQLQVSYLESEIAEKLAEYQSAQDRRKNQGIDSQLKALETKQQETSQEIARLQTSLEIEQASLATENNKCTITEQKHAASSEQLSGYEQQITDFKSHYESLEKQHSAVQQQVIEKRDLLSSLETGISATGDRETGYASEAKRTRQAISEAQNKLRQAQQQKQLLENTLSPEQIAAATATLEGLKAQATELEATIANLEASLGDTSMDTLNDLRTQEHELQARIAEITREMEDIHRRNPSLDLKIAGFSEKEVKGLIAHLFKMKSEHTNKALALEISAGGRLYNVVVDTDSTGAKVLNSGLKRRLTVLPLNKINGQVIRNDRVNHAKGMAPGHVDLALDVVDYENDVANAMRYVFGNTLICKDGKTAEKVTFDPNVRAKSVTLEGDIYDPQGTLSGGAKPEAKGTLLLIERYNTLKYERAGLQHSLDETRERINEAEQAYQEVSNSRQEVELKKHELNVLVERISEGSEASLLAQSQEASSELEKLGNEITECENLVKEKTEYLRQVEKDAAEFNNNKDAKLSELRAEVNSLVTREQQLSNEVSANHDQYEEVKNRLHEIKSDMESQQERLAQSAATIRELTKTIAEHQANRSRLEGELVRLDNQISGERTRISALDSDLVAAAGIIEEKKQTSVELKLEIQNLENQIESAASQLKAHQEHTRKLEEAHGWLISDRHLLGQSGTPYNYADADILQLRRVIETESSRLNTMHNKVNPQVMSMIESVEQKEEALRSMIRQIEHDKRSIQDTVSEIDGYKHDALHKTWTKVSEDLGKVFGELLPQSSAKLEPASGSDLTHGLVVRVRLGTVWKEGLAELSGGQRSLVALSLILALLQFRPAPMYILDEVDAALDMQHTQNIGHIIKTRFKESQFIVVSLKDGMFTNANKIFQTRFQEGTSTVTSI